MRFKGLLITDGKILLLLVNELFWIKSDNEVFTFNEPSVGFLKEILNT